MATRELRLSASSNADFQACQLRYWLSKVCGLRAAKEKDSTRIGSLWHKCHELLELKPESFCPRCSKREEVDPSCYICEGTGRVPEKTMDVVMRHLNKVYSTTPDNMTADDWAVERVQLLYSLVGHQWYYGQTELEFEVIGSEIKFELPVYKPGSSKRLSRTVFVCKIDRLVRHKPTGLVYVWERKSTARSLNEDYWQGLMQGDQVMGYIFGARMAQRLGLLKPYGVEPTDPLVSGAYCDVWHKPTIKPKTLSQKDTKALLADCTYHGEKFTLECSDNGDEIKTIAVNGEKAHITQGKGGIAIHETPDMYGARLLADITARPEFYFEQRTLCRTGQELEQFAAKLPRLAQQIRYVERSDLWVENTGACTATYRCEFCDFCRSGVRYRPGDQAPVGYKLGWGSTPPIPKLDGTEVEIG
ncbi:MAG: PD-(D/E)XK nuclease family protein [Chloroflexi bacterium]|nr:PD-(D/E)XK nuclease family protein [Chloroflexota bacterium]